MKRNVIIVGGGVAGLSAGVYALRCGFDATVLESHGMAGGNCTSWKRKGYLFEGGMHWLGGSNKNEPLNKLWRTVGALNDSVKIHYPEPFYVYNHNGTPIRLYRDVDKTQQYLLSISPGDEKEIKRFCGNIRKVRNLFMPVEDIKGVKTTGKTRPPLTLLFAAISGMGLIRKFANISRDEYVNRFKHEGLRNLIRACTDEKMGAAPLFFTFGELSRGDGGFPEGGSLPFAERIVKTFTGMGGKLLCDTKVSRVLVENGKAVGVIANGARMNADAVIVASDTMTVNDLFEKPLSSPWLERMMNNTKPIMNVLTSFGIDTDLSHYPRSGICKLNKPLSVGSQSFEYIVYTNYARDPVYSPKGKTALTISLPGDTYDFWKRVKDEGRYQKEKEDFSVLITETLAEIIPEARGKVEVCDVATPLTYERYCGNWKGSWMTSMTADMKMTGYPAVIDGLRGVYFAGHRMSPPGGLPPALISGRAAVQYLCRDTDTIFISEED